MKCEFCSSDFVRKETYRAHIISHHKRQLTEQEFDEVLEKIKKFQPPSLDISQFTLEKQKDGAKRTQLSESGDGENEMDIIEEEECEYYEEAFENEDEEGELV